MICIIAALLGIAFGFYASYGSFISGMWPFSDGNIKGPHIKLSSKCPACGHPGCKLEFRPAVKVEVGEKREVMTEPPCVIRKCNTCGALASEKTVLPAEKWIAK